MKLTSKKHWDDFIYGLLYPGFVGSMIYELFLQSNDDAKEYWTLATVIKMIITLFYSVDYLHLYGDMHKTVDENKRSWIYLICDVFSSLFFFFAFVSVKLGHYEWAIGFIAVIPFLFYSYKKKNIADRQFYLPYVIVSLLVFVLYVLNAKLDFGWGLFSNAESVLLIFSSVSFLTYCVYVFSYYENNSKKIDSEIYK